MRYYKLINKDCVHHGLKYQPYTTVTDPIPFCTDGECIAGGIYFFSETQLFEEKFTKFVDLNKIKYICEVTIPEDAQVYHETGKSKASSLTFGEFREAWKDERFCMSAVRHNGYAIQYIDKKFLTHDLCMDAVLQNGRSLKFIKNQTLDLCFAAVQNNGHALEYVIEQTPELCTTAVENNGHALKHVINQTPELCTAAVEKKGSSIAYVMEKTPELCLSSVKTEGRSLKFIDKEMQTPEIIRIALCNNKNASKYIK